MRIVKMDPHESLPRCVLVPPAHGRLEDRARATLLFDEVDGCLTLPVVVVVLVEALIEAEAGVERKCADERPCRVTAAGAQQRGNREVLRIQLEAGVLAHRSEER